MSLHCLPLELLDHIFHHVRPADLVSLSRICSYICPVAQRLLYRHLSVSSRNVGAISALNKKPQLAQYVRTFAVRLASSPVPSSFYHLLADVLSDMTLIISLELFVDPGASWVLLGTRRSVFPRLQHLACSFSLDSHVVDFLGRSKSLLELEVDGISSPLSVPIPTLPAEALPQLCGFKGSSHAAAAIIPGRPVQSIHLHSGDLTQDDVVSIAQSTAHVVILGATTSSSPVQLLQSVSRHLPHLVYLRMMSTFHSGAPDAMFYQNISNALTSLPNLRAFEISGMPWSSSLKTAENRVWQSQPLSTDFGTAGDTHLGGDLDSDFFFA